MPQVNKTRYAILGVLSIMPCSGYDIKKFCDKGISQFWNENFGHIYPVLKQLEKEGLITKEAMKAEGKPPRNVYSITPKGREELTDWLMRPVENTPARLELLLKMTFARNIPREYMIKELESVKQKHEKRLQEHLEAEAQFGRNEQTRQDEGYPYWVATLRYGILDARFRIQWCEETIERIRNHPYRSEVL